MGVGAPVEGGGSPGAGGDVEDGGGGESSPPEGISTETTVFSPDGRGIAEEPEEEEPPPPQPKSIAADKRIHPTDFTPFFKQGIGPLLSFNDISIADLEKRRDWERRVD